MTERLSLQYNYLQMENKSICHLMVHHSPHVKSTSNLVQLLSFVRLFAIPGTATCQGPLSFTVSLSLLKLMSIELVMLSNQLTLCRLLLLFFQSFPTSGSFQMSQVFTSGGQSIGASASASVLPMNI